jgi:hypothetical protein
VSLPRYKAKRDASEPAIVKALEGMGVFVWRLDTPVDLLCIYRGRVFLCEVKSPGKNAKRRQESQELIARQTELHILYTANDAIDMIREMSRMAA